MCSVHSNCESGLVIIYKHAAHRLIQHRLIQHRLQVVVASWSTPPIHTPIHTNTHTHIPTILTVLPPSFSYLKLLIPS